MRKKSDQDLIITDECISEKIKTLSTSPIKIFALGGLGEVGKNIYCIEDEKGILVIDCGVMFPDDTLPGVNYVIPDFSYLQQNQDKIRALVITHGHEDHIGSIPFFLQLVNLPVIYAPKLAASLIRHKVQDFKLTERAKIIEYDGDSVLNVGDFVVSFYHVTHSIPDCYGIVIDTPHGRIVESGDFKIDLTPIDRDFDIAKLAMIGEKGVDLYLGESTNAEKEGYTPSEKSVINSILESFQIAKGRLIISTFASNISRICQIVEATLKFDRKLVIIGRSMETNINIAREYGYIKIPDSSIIDINEINKFRKNEIVILCTGSQGENLAALSRIAKNEHKYVHIILELANGYSNFKRFRNRAMYILNRLETYSKEILNVYSIREKGKERGKKRCPDGKRQCVAGCRAGRDETSRTSAERRDKRTVRASPALGGGGTTRPSSAGRRGETDRRRLAVLAVVDGGTARTVPRGSGGRAVGRYHLRCAGEWEGRKRRK